MIYVSLAELVLLALTISGFLGLLRAKERSHARRVDQLLDKALHAAGRPWTPAPADTYEPPSLYDEDGELRVAQQYARFTLTPEQEP